MNMRRWQGMAVLVLVVGCGYWGYRTWTVAPPPRVNDFRPGQLPDRKGSGVEESDVIEPLVVDAGRVIATPPAIVDDGPQAPVRLEPGMEQPARPDAELDMVPRMPYAED